MKTILGFDSWTGGGLKYARLVEPLKQLGYELILIHLGSWGGDEDHPKEEMIGDLRVRDISYYEGRGFDAILQAEAPSAVIFLSNDVFAHRAFNRYSLARGIPTLRLYHGLVRVQAVGGARQYKTNLWSQLRFVLVRIPKGLFKVWPCYISALWRTGASATDWWRFVADLVSQVKGQYITVAAKDCQTTECAVYAPADVSHAMGKYGHRTEHVHVVGNPDIMAFGLSEEHMGAAATPASCERTEVIYVDTGLIYAGMVYDAPEDFFAHLCATRDALKAQGRTLALKLHPQHFRTDFPDRVRADGMEVLTNDNFVTRLQQCAAAIVEPSTAALIPAIVGVPLLLAHYGKLSAQAYGEVLLEYPRARMLDDPAQINSLLQAEAAALDPEAVSGWIRLNAGPLPAHLMPQRVADVVHRMANAEKDNA
jgi:hypothetical protein